MTATLVPTQMHPVVLKPVARQMMLHHWQDELNYLDKEVDFYCQLLKMSIHNGSGHKKSLLFELLDDFLKFRDSHLPELRSSLNLEGTNLETRQEAALMAMEKMERFTRTLKKLKSNVFPHVHEIQTYTIW